MYDPHSKTDDSRDSKLASFASPGSAFSSSFNLSSTNSHQLCCLTEDGSRCNRVAGNASYSKRIQRTVQQKKLRLSIDNSARHVYICDHHKNMIQSIRSCVRRRRKDSCEDENGTNSNDGYSSFVDNRGNLINQTNVSGPANGSASFASGSGIGGGVGGSGVGLGVGVGGGSGIASGIGSSNTGSGVGRNDLSSNNNPSNEDLPQVDLSTLQMNTLRRYKRHYRVQTRPGINKSSLADTLLNHFKTIPIDEKEAITYFIYMVKCNRNKIDQNKGLTTSNSGLPYSSGLIDHHNT